MKRNVHQPTLRSFAVATVLSTFSFVLAAGSRPPPPDGGGRGTGDFVCSVQDTSTFKERSNMIYVARARTAEKAQQLAMEECIALADSLFLSCAVRKCIQDPNNPAGTRVIFKSSKQGHHTEFEAQRTWNHFQSFIENSKTKKSYRAVAPTSIEAFEKIQQACFEESESLNDCR